MDKPTFHSIAYFAHNEGAGHFFNYHRSLELGLAPYVSDISVYVPKAAHFEADLPAWKKWFSPFYNKRTRKQFWNDCRKLFQQPATGPRIFFIEFFGRRDFARFAVAATLFAKKEDQVWVLYRDDYAVRNHKDLRTIRFVSKLLHKKIGKRLKLFTDSALLAPEFAAWFGKKPHVLPVMHGKESPFEPLQRERIRCSWLGRPRAEKGEVEIAHLVEIDDPGAKRCILDLPGAAYFPTVKNGVQVHLRKSFQTEKEYYQSLEACDVMLLPYDAKKYARRTSGIFVEAILGGKIPLVKEGSWLAYELKRFDLSALIVDWNHPRFFTHLLELVESPELLKKLQAMQQSYQAFHGKDHFVEGFVHHLPIVDGVSISS